jgi:predicted RNase H-like HicB family nuclease
MDNNLRLTMAIRPGMDGWFVGKIVEIPGVLTQGKTVEETKSNLLDALALYLEVEREEQQDELREKNVVVQELSVG